MIKRSVQIFVFLMLTGLCVASFAAASQPVENPVKLINATVVELQNQVVADHANLRNSPKKLFELVKKIVMPHVDVEQMAGLVLGPKWRNSTEQQKQHFIDAFGLVLTRTYINALLTVSDYKVTIYPLRGNGWQTAKYVAIQGAVQAKSGGHSSAVTYYLQRSGDTWKIYDLAVEGVSFMQNFRSQFQSFANMSDILTRLDTMNRKAG